MKRTFFEYCIDNHMLIVAFAFTFLLDMLAVFQQSVFAVAFFTFTFVFTLSCAIIDWKKHG